ncbi:MAG TPA: class I SAM-dependent methyltransferase [Polyangiaceae bacterium]
MTRAPEKPFATKLAELGSVGDAGALAHYTDPAYYTRIYKNRRHDVEYYVELARATGGPVLEYGCGNGRVALAIARAGIDVHGVDLSRPMLDDFERRLAKEPPATRKHVTIKHGDMRKIDLSREFALVIVPFNGIMHLYESIDVEALFARAYDHLEKDGVFVFDFSLPVPSDLARKPDRWYPAPKLRHPTTGEVVKYAERFEYDPIRQLLLIVMRFEPAKGKPWTVPLTHRQFFPREIEVLLRHTGFSDIVLTADFSAHPADRLTDSVVASCRKA